MCRKCEDKRVIVTLLAVALGILVVGFIVEFGVLAFIVGWFGIAGAMCIVLGMFHLVLVLVEFLLLPGFATSTFFLIVIMILLDVLAGFIVTIIASRKDFDFGGA